jgi:hypothetical protein|tara:strand:+ start:143 stop:364 length:222 start_codon:yes stop_codon:yes gene_type:complete
MAKNKTSRRHITGTSITTKSWFGSHAEMVVEELHDGLVVCEDDRGKYVTHSNRLDNGLADPNRYSIEKRLRQY